MFYYFLSSFYGSGEYTTVKDAEQASEDNKDRCCFLK